MFNTSVRSGIFPTEWAEAVVTVIPKSGNLSDPSNSKTISQTPIFAKILEKLIHKRILSYFDENTTLTSYQYRFRPNRSTQESVFHLTKFIYTGLNNKKLISAVCLDVCKAFDSINYELLLLKLREIGFNDLSIKWFQSYLTRKHCVRFNNVTSDVLPVTSGIGQGTILEPSIFIF